MSTPVTLADSHVWEADSWGEGFAPFFISLALWVGALITWLLLRPLQTRALMTSVNGFRMAWGSLNWLNGGTGPASNDCYSIDLPDNWNAAAMWA